ncbi:MAG: RNA-directed DNA polymerase, partial [Gammaproteobacteria bacterium]|nr:RNA-directed DNA polymerase [Gammaproteobacteria bacterium]
MLNQLFDSKAITSAIMPSDVHRWDLWSKPSEIEDRTRLLASAIKEKNYSISPFTVKTHRGKKTYQASCIEDVLTIRILDRYIRRIYKVKQADRSSIIRQTRIMLEDSGDYTIMRLDIAKCYESMNFESIAEKLRQNMILAPNCLKLLYSILNHCKSIGVSGLPRGLAISPTLAELYLEILDKKLSRCRGVIYTSRYVDDVLLIVDSDSKSDINFTIKNELQNLGLLPNTNPNKTYIGPTQSTDFTYLGYHFRVHHAKEMNEVKLTISNEKISKIKTKIVKCLIVIRTRFNRHSNWLQCNAIGGQQWQANATLKSLKLLQFSKSP